jgi:hypothetical protein
MARTPPARAELVALAEKHIYYEVAMLRGGRAEQNRRRAERPDLMRLDRSDPTRIACMAFFEAVLLHARVLSDFLTVAPADHVDDIWAGDYVPNWQPPSPSPLARVRGVTPSDRPLRDSINKQLAHFSLTRLQQHKFYIDHVADEVLRDISTFADDPTNVCHSELRGVRVLLSRDLWPTES